MSGDFFPIYNIRVGKTGQDIVAELLDSSLPDWRNKSLNEGKTGLGPDFEISSTGMILKKAVIEVKFWIKTGRLPIGYTLFKEQVLDRFASLKALGYKQLLVLIGRRPRNWDEVVKWARQNDIECILMSLESAILESIGRFAENASKEAFDRVSLSLASTLAGDFRATFTAKIQRFLGIQSAPNRNPLVRVFTISSRGCSSMGNWLMRSVVSGLRSLKRTLSAVKWRKNVGANGAKLGLPSQNSVGRASVGRSLCP